MLYVHVYLHVNEYTCRYTPHGRRMLPCSHTKPVNVGIMNAGSQPQANLQLLNDLTRLDFTARLTTHATGCHIECIYLRALTSPPPMATLGDVGSDASSVSPTTTTATSATEDQGQMQDQQDGGVAPFATTGDEVSPFAATGFTANWTPDTAKSSSHDDIDPKDPIPPADDLAASPRSSAARFVAPSSYLRPLAPTRDREDHLTIQDRTAAVGEAGAKRPIHPLDREQREGLVSGFSVWETYELQELCGKMGTIG